MPIYKITRKPIIVANANEIFVEADSLSIAHKWATTPQVNYQIDIKLSDLDLERFDIVTMEEVQSHSGDVVKL